MQRYNNNPIITPADIPPSAEGFEVAGAFNPGAVVFQDEILLFIRVAEKCTQPDQDHIRVPTFRITTNGGVPEVKSFSVNDPDVSLKDTRGVVYRGVDYLSTISHIRIARSKNGKNFQVDSRPFISPAFEDEKYGIEDARVVQIEGSFYINYTAVSAYGWCTALARTEGFRFYKRLGIIFHPENKDVALFPQKINGNYAALHRPNNSGFGKPSIWYAESPDLIHWGRHQCIMTPRDTPYESMKIGAGSAPLKTDSGWLTFYHAKGDNSRYALFPLLLEADKPWQVKARPEIPILEPEADYETKGFFPNVVFSNGMIEKNDELWIYYGASDQYCCLATVSREELLQIKDIMN